MFVTTLILWAGIPVLQHVQYISGVAVDGGYYKSLGMHLLDVETSGG